MPTRARQGRPGSCPGCASRWGRCILLPHGRSMTMFVLLVGYAYPQLGVQGSKAPAMPFQWLCLPMVFTTLLHTANNCTRTLLHTAAPRTRLGARLAAEPPTSVLVGWRLREPAFMMLEATPSYLLLCIHDASQGYLYRDTYCMKPEREPSSTGHQNRREKSPREISAHKHASRDAAAHKHTTHPLLGEFDMQRYKISKDRTQASQEDTGAGTKRPAMISPGGQPVAGGTIQLSGGSNFPMVSKAPRNLLHTYGGGAHPIPPFL